MFIPGKTAVRRGLWDIIIFTKREGEKEMEVRMGNGLWTEKPHNNGLANSDLPIMSVTFNGLANSDLPKRSETFNGLANSDLPIMSETFKKSMPYGICRIGVRQPIFAESEFGNPFFLNSGYTYSREKPD